MRQSYSKGARAMVGMRAAMREAMEGYRQAARAMAMVAGGEERARRFSSLFPSSSEQEHQLQEGPPPINPPDPENPDPATLREQWRYATSLYSKWYAHAWGTAILTGLSFFALGWFIKGDNPLLSSKSPDSPPSEDIPKG